MAKKSYIHEQLTQQINEDRTFAQLHDFHTGLQPQKEAFVIYDEEGKRRSYTFQDVKEKSLDVASILVHIGIDKGQRVALMVPNSIQFVWCYLAMNRIGANVVVIPLTTSVDVTKTILQRLKCQAFLFHPSGDRSSDQSFFQMANNIVREDRIIAVTTEEVASSTGFKYHLSELLKTTRQLNLDEVYKRQDDIHLDDPFLVIFTSGSTGIPKAIQYTHRAVVSVAFLFAMHCVGTEIDAHPGNIPHRIFNDRPFSWVGCLLVGFNNVFTMGFTFVVCPTSRSVSQCDPDFFIRILQDEKCSEAFFLTYLIHDLITNPHTGNFDLSHLKRVLTGGQIISPNVLAKLRAVLPNITLVNIYAMSEIFPIALKTVKPTDGIDTLSYLGMRVCSPVEVKILNDDKEIVPIEEKGEICVRCPYSFQDYLEDPIASMRVDSSGWIFTDDAGYIDQHGGLHVCGRISEVIDIANVKVYPCVLEMVLSVHPDVKAVVILGVPNERLGEEICACVIPKPGSRLESSVAEFEEWVFQQWNFDYSGLTRKEMHTLVMEEFPLAKTGKTDRKALKVVALQKLGRQ